MRPTAMRRLPTVPALLAALLLALLAAGCDFADDDEAAERFEGTWQLTAVLTDDADVTELILARFDEVIVTFIEDGEDFVLLGDVSGTADDLLVNGTFDADGDDRELDLTTLDLPETADFTYDFLSSDRVVLTTDTDEEFIELIFGIDLGDVDQLTLELTRSSQGA